MCLAVPLRITELHDQEAIGERNGITRKIRVDFITDPQIGDYVLVHAGFAIEKVSGGQAEEDLAIFSELETALQEIRAGVKS